MPQENLPSRRFGWFFPVFSVVLYGVVVLLLFTVIRHGNGGTFVYTLDDTYIHLALSDSIAHGTYGVNAGEATSPSSSLLWPLLLAPFARLAWFTYVPLLLNFVFGAAAAWLFGEFVAGLRKGEGSAWTGLWRGLLVVGLLVAGNLAALTFIGMEHALQVLLAGACAWGVVACMRGQRMPWWCVAAGVVGPSVRYENLGLTLALGLALWAARRRPLAVLVCGVSVLPLAAFAVFLRHLGLPALPLSVLVKGHAVDAHHNLRGAIAQHLSEVADNFLDMPIVWVLTALFVVLVAAWLTEAKEGRRLALFGAAAAVGLHLLIGRFGWHNRYEVYIILFAVLVCLEIDWGLREVSLGWYVIGLAMCGIVYAEGSLNIPMDSHVIYLQQFQTSRLTHSLRDTNVAVNDLGLVAYHHPRTQYVLDLAGLASVEAASVPHTTEWMDSITRRHHVGLVAIYPNWFPEVPVSWSKIGDLCRGGYDPCVSYYLTGVGDGRALRDAFVGLTRSLPPDVTVTLP